VGAGSFPVVCQELVRYLAPDATKGKNIMVGEALVRAINPAVYEEKATLTLPGDKKETRPITARPREGSDALWFTFTDTLTAGVYQLELTPKSTGVSGPSTPRIESFAVELDPREGELAKADPISLQKTFADVNLRVEAPSKSLLQMTESERSELWRFCAFALLAILAAEGVLSFIAAHHGSSASQEEVEAARRGRETRPDRPVSLPVAEDRPAPLPIAGGR
jgi:hypothetical protein